MKTTTSQVGQTVRGFRRSVKGDINSPLVAYFATVGPSGRLIGKVERPVRVSDMPRSNVSGGKGSW